LFCQIEFLSQHQNKPFASEIDQVMIKTETARFYNFELSSRVLNRFQGAVSFGIRKKLQCFGGFAGIINKLKALFCRGIAVIYFPCNALDLNRGIPCFWMAA